jgi:H+/Cl- antiporter ClcA
VAAEANHKTGFPNAPLQTLRNISKWLLLGGIVGVLAGCASALFLTLLAEATRLFQDSPALLFALPIAGFAVGWIYWRIGGTASQGNNLVIEEVHIQRQRVPFRMGPLVLAGTVLTHLFGGSAGREGTAIQMGASLADSVRRLLRLDDADRRLMLMAGISAGFASVFGTPAAGFVFGMEVQSVGRIRYEGALPCLVAALIGDFVTRAWGVGHSIYPVLGTWEIDSVLLLKVGIAGVAFGMASLVFVRSIHSIKRVMQRYLPWSPLRPLVGGVIVVILTLLAGTTDYNGLSLPLIQQSVRGEQVFILAFALKILFTAVTLGSGFLGGEVTPLFVIGATCGAALSGILGVDQALLACVGFVAVFAGASNTPLACTLMGVELFGGGGVVYLLVGCVIAYLVSGPRGIYETQRVDTPKWYGLLRLNEPSDTAEAP